MNHKNFVITNLTEAVTLKPLGDELRFTSIKATDLGRVKNSWIAVSDGKISGIGSGPVTNEFSGHQQIDCRGCVALPGLIDAHTHPVFAGVRADEFCMRLDGATYEEIAKKGGGIQSSVTRTASVGDDALEDLVQDRLNKSASHGVTTVEMKSGYGLSIEEELRHLRIIQKIKKTSLQTISSTCLALHAVPKDQPSAKAWADLCAEKLLPVVKSENLADAVDAFVENGYFTPSDCENYLTAAKRFGLNIRLHADEFSNSKAALCAAKFGALSADHLQHADKHGIQAMAKAGVVALLLPGTSLYTSIPYTDSRPFKEAGCPVGLATDFNPGSCPIDNLRLILTMGALHCKLTMAEAIAAVTWVPARSLRLEDSKGALTVGRDADILVMPLASCEEFVADLGRTKPRAVFARGHQLV
ncbi:MAG: imidazolonepropionase [bacterium]